MPSIAKHLIVICSVGLIAHLAPASDTTEPTTATTAVVDDSPKGALKAYNAAMRTGDVAGMVALENVTNDDERRVARSCAQSDLEVGKLIKAAREKFGDDAAKKVSEAVTDEDDAAIDAAKESIDGTHGGVTFPDSDDPSPLIHVDGVWKVDIAAMLKHFDGTADAMSDQIIRRGSAAKVTTQELVDGQFNSPDALVDTLKRRLKDE